MVCTWRRHEDETKKGMIRKLFPHLCLKDSFSELMLQFAMSNPLQLRRSSVGRSCLLPTLVVHRSHEDVKLIKEPRKFLMILIAISLQFNFLCDLISSSKNQGLRILSGMLIRLQEQKPDQRHLDSKGISGKLS